MTTRSTKRPSVYTIQQLAPLLHLSRATITRAVREGLKLTPQPYIWKGHRFQLTSEDVRALILLLRPSMQERVREAAREAGILPPARDEEA